MGKKAIITIYQSKDDPDMKRMIRDLKKLDSKSNEFRNRSESEIAKMILQTGLEEKHNEICG
jgi:hypothetical protein